MFKILSYLAPRLAQELRPPFTQEYKNLLQKVTTSRMTHPGEIRAVTLRMIQDMASSRDVTIRNMTDFAAYHIADNPMLQQDAEAVRRFFTKLPYMKDATNSVKLAEQLRKKEPLSRKE